MIRDHRILLACVRDLAFNLSPQGKLENDNDGNIEAMCERVRDKVKRQAKKYRDLKVNNEEF